jgi:hypothetical protein
MPLTKAIVPPDTPGTRSAAPIMKPITATLRWNRNFMIKWRNQVTKKAGFWGNLPAKRKVNSNLGTGLAQTLNAIARAPLTALAEELNAFETLEDVAFNYDSLGTLETFVL